VALKPGDTVHIPDTGPPHDRGKPHLFVILTNPCDKGMALLVPICTIRGRYDTTCPVKAGEHEFVTDESYVAYHFINQYSIAALEKQLSDGTIKGDKPIESALLTRVCNGVSVSRHCPPVEKKYYEQQQTVTAPKKA
jgi:hypothetical protein